MGKTEAAALRPRFPRRGGDGGTGGDVLPALPADQLPEGAPSAEAVREKLPSPDGRNAGASGKEPGERRGGVRRTFRRLRRASLRRDLCGASGDRGAARACRSILLRGAGTSPRSRAGFHASADAGRSFLSTGFVDRSTGSGCAPSRREPFESTRRAYGGHRARRARSRRDRARGRGSAPRIRAPAAPPGRVPSGGRGASLPLRGSAPSKRPGPGTFASVAFADVLLLRTRPEIPRTHPIVNPASLKISLAMISR